MGTSVQLLYSNQKTAEALAFEHLRHTRVYNFVVEIAFGDVSMSKFSQTKLDLLSPNGQSEPFPLVVEAVFELVHKHYTANSNPLL